LVIVEVEKEITSHWKHELTRDALSPLTPVSIIVVVTTNTVAAVVIHGRQYLLSILSAFALEG
jgi:hypothetical protein